MTSSPREPNRTEMLDHNEDSRTFYNTGVTVCSDYV